MELGIPLAQMPKSSWLSEAMQLSENVIIITGVTGNLGSVTASAFQAAGYRTVLVDRSQERLRQVFAGLADSPQHFLAGGVNLSDPASLSKLVTDNRK